MDPAQPLKLTPEQAPVVPREFVTKPFFPARSQDKPRVIECTDSTWTIGVGRVDHRGNATEVDQKPGFDIRHGRLCFALLTFRDRVVEDRAIHFSINELAHRYANSNGGRYSRALINLLYDLRDTWVRVDHRDGRFDQFSIIESIRIHGRPARRRDAHRALQEQTEMWFDFVHLNPTFFGLMRQYEDLARIRLDVLNSMRSQLAQSIYTFLPSRAVYHSMESPFEITLSNVLEQVGMNVPRHKSVRLKLFKQNNRPVFDQLEGAETLSGTLHVSWCETADGSDYKLQAWVDVPPPLQIPSINRSAFLEDWLQAGGSRETFQRRVRFLSPIMPEQERQLRRIGVMLGNNTDAVLRIAAALLGKRFDAILFDMAVKADRGSKGENPTGLLIWRLREAVRSLKHTH